MHHKRKRTVSANKVTGSLRTLVEGRVMKWKAISQAWTCGSANRSIKGMKRHRKEQQGDKGEKTHGQGRGYKEQRPPVKTTEWQLVHDSEEFM
eukprot:1154264-Pelagomonas_calceolata.AAC.8